MGRRRQVKALDCCQTVLFLVRQSLFVLSKSGQTICVVHFMHCQMQLRDKRAKSPPTQECIPRRRALDHRSRKEATLSSLRIQQNSDNSAGHLSFPGKFRLLVKGNLWTTWSHDPSTIPLYILDALAHNPKSRADMRHTIHEMELTEGIFRAGDNYVVDEIEKDGAEMLVTKNGQTEIAFAVGEISNAQAINWQ